MLINIGFGDIMVVFSRGIKNAIKNPMRTIKEMLPEKITLQQLCEDVLFERADKKYFIRTRKDFASLGFKIIGGFTVPEMAWRFT